MNRWLNIQELSPEERRSVLEDLFVFGRGNQLPSLVRQGVLLVLSTVIATAGLISDSAAVVIGAMLVAPLMTPVLAAAAAVVMGWQKRFYQSIYLLLMMALGALLLSSAMTLISPELLILPEQVLARTRPTFWDLVIALAAGAAGAYTITRKQSNAIPGVAVAVALLPPLASTGILFTSGNQELALRALVLFLTNFVAMVLSGAITFLLVGVSPAGARARSAAFVRSQLWLFFLLTLAISAPLWIYSERVIFNADYQAARSTALQDWLKRHELELLGIEIFAEEARLELALAGPRPPTGIIEELHLDIIERHELEDEQNFRVDYTWTQKLTGSWPAVTTTAAEAAVDLQAAVADAQGDLWRWVRTDFADGQSTLPGADEAYGLTMDEGELVITAPCGSLRGEVTVTRQTLNLTFSSGRNWLHRACRNDPALSVFIADLQSARQLDLDGDTLRLSLRDGTGVMSFSRE